MKTMKVILIFLSILIIVTILITYVYIGTYIFPIAPYWVTQLPPNPPKPQITYGEFNFKMLYSINGKVKEVSDIIACEFKGFEVKELGGEKQRVWSENIKNENSYELFSFRDDDCKANERTYSAICVENIGAYKVILHIAKAEWFLGDPDYKSTPEMPILQVYDTKSKYYLDPLQRDVFLRENNFEVIEWFCDDAVTNVFD